MIYSGTKFLNQIYRFQILLVEEDHQYGTAIPVVTPVENMAKKNIVDFPLRFFRRRLVADVPVEFEK